MKIKVCGLNNVENIKKIIDCRPDYVGIIFYEKSARYAGNVDDEFIKSKFETVIKTGVFVNEKNEVIKSKIKEYNLSAVQLHGEETTDQCQELKATGIEVIKAFSIENNFNFDVCKRYEKHCDKFLFDTKCKGYGGSGQKFNHEILKNYQLQTPFLISGGISLEDISSIMKLNLKQLTGIDLNSKFEITPGIKDVEKIKAAIKKTINQ